MFGSPSHLAMNRRRSSSMSSRRARLSARISTGGPMSESRTSENRFKISGSLRVVATTRSQAGSRRVRRQRRSAIVSPKASRPSDSSSTSITMYATSSGLRGRRWSGTRIPASKALAGSALQLAGLTPPSPR